MINLMSQQQDVIEQLYNHPSIVAWVPLNESWGVRKMLTNQKQQDFARSMYYMTKAFDNTRIISSNDGWENITETDILAIHDYDAYGNNFEEKYKKENYDIMFPMWRKLVGFNEKYDNQPVILTEFGGVSYGHVRWQPLPPERPPRFSGPSWCRKLRQSAPPLQTGCPPGLPN